MGVCPVVNIDEKIGKSVGRRKIQDSFVHGPGLQKLLARLRGDVPFPAFPKGVFKFRSFEEADAWTMHCLTKPRR